jgi:peptide/nickel transport system permease protein
MTGMALRRVLAGLLVVWIVTTIVFALVHFAGDPAAAALGQHGTAAQKAAFRKKHGLDQPWLEQYTSYLGITPCHRVYPPDDPLRIRPGARCGLLQGDLGRTYLTGEPVTQVIADRLPRTMLLGGMTLLIELLFGVLLGVVAARKRHTWIDSYITTLTIVGSSIPTYVTGPVTLSVFAAALGLFPVGGYGEGALGHVHHALLPALLLGTLGAAGYARIVRGEMIEVMQSDFVRTARAKGLRERDVVLRHGLRNAILPVVTLIGLSLPTLVSGAIITEKVFGWPGLGSLTIQAVNGLEAPTLLGVVIVFAVTVQIGNVAADLGVAALDPRTRK